jgi:SAM-dependent methyltransferase
VALRDLIAPGVVLDELMGVPFASKDARRRKAAAGLEAVEILMLQRAQLADLEQQIKLPALMRRTRDRLKALRDLSEEHLHNLELLFRPLGNVPLAEANQALAHARAGFSLLRYYEHLFRDWAWGESELHASLELARKLPLPKPQQVLALGAGACRFPFELHRALNATHTLCVDLSPLLLSCAARVARGEKLTLVELPPMPASVEDQAVRTTLSCAQPLSEGFEVLVNDLEEWALRDAAFDLVVTHWVIDAVPTPAAQLFSLINRALKPGGRWLNLGPTGFNSRVLANNFSREEVVGLAEKCGFALLGSEVARLPYFQNPRSAHWRTEQVFAFVAEKKAECSEAPGAGVGPLPGWLEDRKQPIALSADVGELARSYRFCAELLDALQPGTTTLEQLVQQLGPKHGLTPEQAEHLIGGTLLQWVALGRQNLQRE